MKFEKAAAIVVVMVLSGCQAWQQAGLVSSPVSPPRSTQTVVPSSGAAAPDNGTPSPAFKAFPIYTDRSARRMHYAPSGYMGDSDLSMSGAYTTSPTGKGPCMRVIYKASGVKGWAGIDWQDPANNWGDVPGQAGYDLRGATQLIFWARGENGGEKVHEFRIGGIVGQYPDSDVASISNIRLSKEWKQYTIDLQGKDLRHIICGFGFFVNKAENPGGMMFYLDDIFYAGPEGLTPLAAAVEVSSSPMIGEPPSVSASTGAIITSDSGMTVPTLPSTSEDLSVKSMESGLRVSFSSHFQFEPGRALLAPGSEKVLSQFVDLLNAYPSNAVLIEGHTDNTGSAAYNLQLSRLRATAVRDYLIRKGGYDAARFRVVGYGDTRPVADNNTKVGRSLNRRVEITILKSVTP